jgi:hypothetical protein
MKILDADPSLASRPDIGSGVSDRARFLLTLDLADLSCGDVAFCLRQGIAISHVMPLALSALVKQPFLEAELYPGDLLAAILRCPLWHRQQRGIRAKRYLHSGAFGGGNNQGRRGARGPRLRGYERWHLTMRSSRHCIATQCTWQIKLAMWPATRRNSAQLRR